MKGGSNGFREMIKITRGVTEHIHMCAKHWLEAKGRLGVRDRDSQEHLRWNRCKRFKEESDVVCLVLRTQTWLLVKNKLKGHIVEKERMSSRLPLR